MSTAPHAAPRGPLSAGDAEGLRLAWWEAWSPAPDERDYELREIEGEIPRELRGTLYRNGPSQRVLPKEGYAALHLFDGDALVHALRIEEGRVHYRGRYVREPGFLHEEKAGPSRQHFLGFRVAEPDPEAPPRLSPNTHVIRHAGRLLALSEACLPVELDPATLATRGTHRWTEPMLGASTSAHPKVDGRTGELWIHGYQPFPPFVQLYAVAADGRCTLAEPVETPYSVMMHDMALTEHYAILLLCPVTFDVTPEGTLVDWLHWRPELGLRFGVRRREPGSPLRWVDAPAPAWIFHPANAWEEEGRIVIDACVYPKGGELLEGLRSFRSGRLRGDVAAHPTRYEIDPQAGSCRETRLDERGWEFPRVDERRVAHPSRFGYALCGVPDALGPGEKRILKYEPATGATREHLLPPGHYPGEPVFVPRGPEAAEDEGFVLSVVFDGTSGRSYLLVLDARAVEAAPLARAHLEHRIPLGFHGSFAADRP